MANPGGNGELYRRLEDPPELDDTVLVVALEGWIDAGAAAAAAGAALATGIDARPVAHFDDEALLDFRARRPLLHLRDGVVTGLDFVKLELVGGRDVEGHDVLVLTGPEPDRCWRSFADAVLDLAAEFGTHTVCTLGAYPMPVPHTRPSRLAATSSDPEMIRQLALEQGTADLPAGVASLLELAAHERGLTSVGLWAQVPHYAASMAYPPATMTLLDGLRSVTGVHVAPEEVQEAARASASRIDELVKANPDHVAMLRQLEERYDDAQRSAADDRPLPSGDELVAELERYLRDQPD